MLYHLHTSLFNSSPISMWVANREDLAYVEVNDEALRLYGYSREEFLTMTAFDLRDVGDTKFLVEKKNVFTDFKIQEAVHYKKNRERIFVEVTGKAMHYKGRETYLVMVIDITERKLAEEKFKVNQQLLLTSEEMGKIGSWEVNFVDMDDWSKNTSTWSDQGYRNFGYEPGTVDVNYSFFLDHVHPEDKHLVSGFSALFIPGIQREVEFRIIWKDGSIKNIHGKFYIIFDEKNVPIKMIGMCQDITERKLAEENLKNKQRLLLSSEKIGNIGSFEILLEDMVDWRNNPTILSDGSYDLYGYEPESEVSFDRFMRLIHPDDAHLIMGNPEGLFQSSQTMSSEYRIVLSDGTLKHIHSKLNVVFDKEKNIPIKLIGVAQDITERKKLEIDLDNFNRKLKDEIEKQTKELTLANKNLDSFNHSISHDLSTPLRAMDMYIGLLKENLTNDEENIEYVQKIDLSILEMKNMISSLLDLSKYSKIELHKESIDMDLEINKCIESLRNKNSNGKININIHKTPSIKADKYLIKNILLNLIGNAIKYSSKEINPTIEISGITDENYTIYSIKDNGDGFDSSLKSKLFKPFSRLHNDSEFEGNGVGLAVVERIMSRHGGSIWAEGEKGKGATFYIQFPNN